MILHCTAVCTHRYANGDEHITVQIDEAPHDYLRIPNPDGLQPGEKFMLVMSPKTEESTRG